MHQTAHFLWSVGLLVASIGTMVVVRNRIIRRRLLWSALFLLLAVVLHFVIVDRWNLETDPAARSFIDAFLTEHGWKVEGLLVAFACLNALVPLLFNPWFRDQPSDKAPAIVQDTLVAAFGVVAAMAIFQNSTLFTSSAIAAAILGFALQDTLGNAISGIAIQIEKPFRVGHWISVGGFEGLVTEVTWRATKIRTKAGTQVIVPNSTIAKEAINNYSEPTAPTRLEIEVGAAYQTPPNDVKAAILRAIDQAPGVLKTPLPDALLVDFANSSINYRARFWIDDFSRDNHAKDAVRTAIYYEFRRRNIEIPYPIQVEYSKEEAPADTPERRDRFRQALAAVHVLAPLPAEAHSALAATVVGVALRERRGHRPRRRTRRLDVHRPLGRRRDRDRAGSPRSRRDEGRRLLRRDVTAHRRSADGDRPRARRHDRARDQRRGVPRLRQEQSRCHRRAGGGGRRAPP